MINTVRLRCLLGWLGMLLPWIVVALTGAFPDSISATYYSPRAGTVFTGILCSASFLLISYRGYDRFDDVLNTVAGAFGLGICLFPCRNDALALVGTFQLRLGVSGMVHNLCAVAFFACLSFNSLFRFTKRGALPVTERKRKRNVIYVVCGLGMIGAFLLFFLPDFYAKTWLIETIALFFFGLSFLTKADHYPWLFADRGAYRGERKRFHLPKSA